MKALRFLKVDIDLYISVQTTLEDGLEDRAIETLLTEKTCKLHLPKWAELRERSEVLESRNEAMQAASAKIRENSVLFSAPRKEQAIFSVLSIEFIWKSDRRRQYIINPGPTDWKLVYLY